MRLAAWCGNLQLDEYYKEPDMLPILMPRDTTPDIPLSPDKVESKWVPKVGETIEVAHSATNQRLQRKFVRMQGNLFIVRSYTMMAAGGELAFDYAWPIKRMSGPDMTPKVEASPLIFLAESAAQTSNSGGGSQASTDSQESPATEREAPAAADPDGWIAWAGGECPVPGGTQVHIRMAYTPHIDEPPQSADSYRWDHQGAGCDIIAYRVAK